MKKRVLIVDDAIDKLKSHIRELQFRGFEILEAKNINVANHICEKEINSIDFILLDVKMIECNDPRAGIQFAYKLINEFAYKKPIIFFTVLSEDNDSRIVELLKLPFIFHIRKGLTVSRLYEEIEKTLIHFNNQK